MKKIKKFLRFCFISAIVLVVYIYVCRFIFKLLWRFDILDKKPYQLMAKYWDEGGVFNTFHDVTLGIALILLPIIWLILSRKVYKIGLGKCLLIPIEKIYRSTTRPEDLEIEHVTIKNMGSSGKNIEDIITEKIKEKNPNGIASEHVSRDLRKQIAAKIEENENQ